MSHWGYVIEALLSEDRDATERRIQAKRRKRRREQAMMAASTDALPQDAHEPPVKRPTPVRAATCGRAGQGA